MKHRSAPYITGILVLAILVVVNELATRFSFRLDFSEDRQYTLSQSTVEIIESLRQPVTVKAYFSNNLPPQLIQARNQFKNLLVEYAASSRGRIVFEFTDPAGNEALEKLIVAQGVRPLTIEVREKDQKKQQRAYMAAVVEYNNEHQAIPIIQPGGPMEYNLSRAIRKISGANKPKIAFIQGHGEPSLNELAQVVAELEVAYNPEHYYIAGGTVPGPDRFPAMVWLRPTDSIPASDFEFMNAYLKKGGRLLVGFNLAEGDFVNMLAIENKTGMKEWLLSNGVSVLSNLVIDDRCGTVSVQQNEGATAYTANVPFPFLPMLQGQEQSIVSNGLESIMFEFPSEIVDATDSSAVFVPVLKTSAKSGVLSAPQPLDVSRQWSHTDFTRSGIVVGASVSGSFGGSKASKLLVFSDGDFVVNGPPQQPREVQSDNVKLLVNGVDWLTDNTGLIALRNRGVVARPIDSLSDNSRTLLKYLNFLGPIVLVIILGLVVAQRKRAIRNRRKQQTIDSF